MAQWIAVSQRHPEPAVAWEAKITISVGVFSQEHESVMGVFIDHPENMVNPFFWNPFSKQITYRTYEYFRRLFYEVGFKKSF